MKAKSSGAAIYKLKVTLRGSKPPIWRRFLVPSDITLGKLHVCLQEIMGWDDAHLHQFEARGACYGTPDPGFEHDRENEDKAALGQVLRRRKDRMVYEYDFGDSWRHDILLEDILPPDPSGPYPKVLTGKRACPPEDVGGVYGYQDFLEALADPDHPQHDEIVEWLEDDFDPEAFSVEALNAHLQEVFVRRKR